VPESVSCNTGNIHFAGDVVVQGSVDAGFSVYAAGNVIITGTVESGSGIFAQGDVVVGVSIMGKRTVVKAGGFIRTQNIHEATVSAGRDILLSGYAFHARLRAGGFIQVTKAGAQSSKYSGSIMGGEAWASSGIDTNSAGTPAWGHTELMAGILPEQSEKLDDLQKNIEVKNTHIRQLLDHFGLTSINLDKIRGMIEQSQGLYRKSMALKAKSLAKAGKKLQELLAKREQILAQIGPVSDMVEIKIRERAYPNVVIRIGNKKRMLSSELGELGAVRFHIDNQELIVS